MEALIIEWLNLFFRWFHVIAGIAWIGASFYFVWLDNSLENPPQWKKDKGIGGDLWAIHGGGFYEVAKYKLGPEKMPQNLHWFKWEAYTTWLTGMVMLWIVYYLGAERYLIDSSRLELSAGEATAAGLAFIAVGVGVYEALLRTPLKDNGKAFGAVLFAFLVFMTWLACSIFAPRGAYIHVGAVLGTIMAGNVLLGIMPSQRALVEAVQRGEAPDPSYGAFAKLRSTHNNYFTLPLIFIMISNHYPITYTHEYNWLVLSAIGFITAFARHFFNLRHRGEFKPQILVAAALMLVALAGFMAHSKMAKQAAIASPAPSATGSGESATTAEGAPLLRNELSNGLSDEQGLALMQARCATCHALSPTQAGFVSAPAGVMLETLAQIKPQTAKLIEVTQSGYMPLGNMTQMTDAERAQMLAWLAQMGN